MMVKTIREGCVDQQDRGWSGTFNLDLAHPAIVAERLRGNKARAGALAAITAAAVGGILKLSIWFAVYTMLQPIRGPKLRSAHTLKSGMRSTAAGARSNQGDDGALQR